MSEITCIICPMGCKITVTISGNEVKTTGEGCPRGQEYAKTETIAPKRILTAVMALEGRTAMLPVKTACPIPKEKLFEAMSVVKTLQITPPVAMGQVLLENLAGTGVSLVATKNVT